MDYALHVCYWLNISLAFCFMEVDRIQARSTVLEAKELQHGYRGEVLSLPGSNMFQHASTSVIPQSNRFCRKSINIKIGWTRLGLLRSLVYRASYQRWLTNIFFGWVGTCSKRKAVLRLWFEISHILKLLIPFGESKVHRSLPEVQLSMRHVRKKQMKQASAKRLPTK